MADMEKDVASFEKNKYQDIRVRLSEYQGNDVIDIRVWTQPPQGTEKVPTGKGININVKLFPKLKDAIAKLEKVLAEEMA
ncbi:MAG: transcriptional coactivator p15/PC4 family protein [Candidatus Omnitrophica bacterium]|nr:transcriptional coactivator p15/PC4 family protein [Candidatus Omnitrophota bacterium]